MNKVVILGRLTKDPALSYAQGKDMAICRFTVAVNRMKKDDGADFINCVAFSKTAETIAQYFTKGRQIALTGHIQTGSYEKDGIKHYTTDVIVETFDFIADGKKDGQKELVDLFQDAGVEVQEDITPVTDGDMPF